MSRGTAVLLRTVVGSQAHGLATPESDTDIRGVFILPTEEILSLGGKVQQTNWKEGKDDETSWELGHFLFLATKCNPTILEVFLAPVHEASPEGYRMRELFPYIWNSQGVRDAFIGYGLNQRKKFLDGKDSKPNKFAAAYLRALVNGYELLSTGTFTIRVADLPIGQKIRRFKEGGYYSVGEVMDTCLEWEERVKVAFKENPNKKADLDVVNDFLLGMRRQFWT